MENRLFKRKDLSKIFDGKNQETIRSWIDKGYIPLKEEGGRARAHIFGFDEVLKASLFMKFYDMGYDARFADRLAKKVTAEDWHSVIEEGKLFFVLENFEHARACQVRTFDEFEGPFVVDEGAEGVMIINGKRLLEEVKQRIKNL